MAASDRILASMRERLTRFVNRREKAYKKIRATGIPVPRYKEKMEAVATLRVQLEASKNWSLRAHINWVWKLRHLVLELLPYEFHDDPAQVTYRKKMLDLLKYVDEQRSTETLFNKTLTT